MSCITCNVSHVTCHKSYVKSIFLIVFYKVVELAGGGFHINKPTPTSIEYNWFINKGDVKCKVRCQVLKIGKFSFLVERALGGSATNGNISSSFCPRTD